MYFDRKCCINNYFLPISHCSVWNALVGEINETQYFFFFVKFDSNIRLTSSNSRNQLELLSFMLCVELTKRFTNYFVNFSCKDMIATGIDETNFDIFATFLDSTLNIWCASIKSRGTSLFPLNDEKQRTNSNRNDSNAWTCSMYISVLLFFLLFFRLLITHSSWFSQNHDCNVFIYVSPTGPYVILSQQRGHVAL